jgi:hypothetical protein
MSQGWVPIDINSRLRAQYSNQPYIDQSENSCHARPTQPLMNYNPNNDLYSHEPNSRPPCWSVPFVARGGAVAPPGLGLY